MTDRSTKEASAARRKSNSAPFWTTVSAVAACVATVFAGWAAWETHRSAVETNRATRAGVWLQLLAEYGSPEMFSSMKTLRSWQQQHPKDFAAQFKVLLLKKDSTAQDSAKVNELDAARRRVTQFFGKLQVMSEERVIDEQLIGMNWTSSTYRFVADVLTPMEQAKGEATLESGAETPRDKAEDDRAAKDQLSFYRRVLHLPIK